MLNHRRAQVKSGGGPEFQRRHVQQTAASRSCRLLHDRSLLVWRSPGRVEAAARKPGAAASR